MEVLFFPHVIEQNVRGIEFPLHLLPQVWLEVEEWDGSTFMVEVVAEPTFDGCTIQYKDGLTHDTTLSHLAEITRSLSFKCEIGHDPELVLGL